MAAFKGKMLSELHGKALARRYRQVAQRPDQRKLVPTQYLTPAQQHQRAERIRLDQPVTPGSPLTERGLARESNAAMQVQYGPQERLAARQVAATPDYYAAFVNALQGQQKADQQRTTDAANATQALYSTGTQAPGSPQPQIGQAQAGTIQALGAAQANQQSALMTAARAGGLQALQMAGQRQSDLARDKGAANLAYRAKRRAEEGQTAATMAVASGRDVNADAQRRTELIKAGINPDTMKYDPSLKPPPKPKEKTPVSPIDQLKIDFFNKHGYWPPTGPPKEKKPGKGKDEKPTTGPGSLSSSEEHKRVDQVEKVYGLLTNPILELKNPTTGAVSTKRLSPVQMRDHLRAQGVNPLILRVALSRLHNKGKVGKDGLNAAHSLGLHVSGRWGIVG